MEAEGERFRNTEVSERLLVRDSPESIATFVGDQGDLHWQVLDLLPDALRTGRPYAMHEERRDDRERWEAYIRGLFEISRAEHAANAALVPVEDPRAQVDVAGGHGAFSMAMCDRHPELHATVLDLPPSAAVGRRIVEEQGYADRISFREGDVFELGLGDADSLDVVSVFNLAHHLPEERNRELCRMARAALQPGGCMVIGDSARPEPGEPVSEHGAISSLLFYAWSHSRNFTPSEIRGWMEAAGVRRGRGAPQRALAVARGGGRAVILLTGATGTVGSALLRRLTLDGRPVRALVRDPRRLGDQRVRVQIALGDLADPPSFRNALRGVHTVVHMAASIRDQPRASIEELNALATLRLVRAAERAGAQRFLFFSAMCASHHSRTRFFRAKALAQEAVEESSLDTTIFAPSIVYTPGDPWITLLDRLSRLPAVPVSGSGRALYQPVWAEDVADAVMAALSNGASGSYDLAGPQILSYDDIVRTTLRACGPPPQAAARAAAGRASDAPRRAPARRARRSSPPGRRRSCWRSRWSQNEERRTSRGSE